MRDVEHLPLPPSAVRVHYDGSGVCRGRSSCDGEVVGVSLRRPLRRHATSAAAWASAVERYRRAIERYDAVVRLMPERSLRHELGHLAGPLEAVLEDFEDALAQRDPQNSTRDQALLGCVQRAATLCAHATEAAMMANDAAWRYDQEDVARCLDTVRLLVKKIDGLGDEARPPT